MGALVFSSAPCVCVHVGVYVCVRACLCVCVCVCVYMSVYVFNTMMISVLDDWLTGRADWSDSAVCVRQALRPDWRT